MILVTGATGFLGRHLVPALQARGLSVRAAVRSDDVPSDWSCDICPVGDLAKSPPLAAALDQIQVVVHLAARAHVLAGSAEDEAELTRANVDATRHLAKAAAGAGVRRLVYLSSVKVNGESTRGRPFCETDPPDPQDAYGRTKWQAELALAEIAAETGLERVIIRPPLVYGPAVKANFLQLLSVVWRAVPLPLGSVRNLRSLVSVWNLCDFIRLCCSHPAAAGETFLVSDQADLSTPEIIWRLAQAMGRPTRLLPCPPAILLAVGRALQQGHRLERLVGSLQVDSTKATRLLGWRPPVTVGDGLARTARWYVEARR